MAAWSAYAFETAVCYTREFRNPKTDTFKAIFWSGILCLAAYSLVPIAFQGSLGVDGMSAPGIVDGSGVAAAMTGIIGGGPVIGNLLVVLLILALLLGVSTSMAGSSRTLYQGSVDGWLPRYLSHVNHHGAPTRAMWTDLLFNVLLLNLSDSLFVLAVSNICYLVFIYLNLHAGWIHRIDNGHVPRPYRCPDWIMGLGIVLAFVNAFMLGGGANVWGAGTLTTGVIALALIIPVFWYRHYATDGGKFPAHMLADLHMSDGLLSSPKAGILPYLALAAGALVVFGANAYFHW
jgi:amino acid transporter